MIKDGMNTDREPLPRYAMPDGSEPEYEAILEQIQYQRKSMIGSAFFYIRAGAAEELCLCRIIPGGWKIFSMRSSITRSTGYLRMIGGTR